jgi:8-oxo-dGTP diphosphatase
MSAPQTLVIDVAAALVFRGGKLLITQRRANDHLGGLWEFPGGKREPGESFEECLARELREELGIEVSVGELLESLTHAYPEKVVHLRFFRCSWTRHEPQTLGCAAFEWVEPEQLDAFQFPPADARLLRTLRKRRDLWAPST